MTTPTPGIYENVPFDEYRSWDAINNSSLAAATKSMRHYREQQPREETEALKLGRFIHAGALEPLVALQNYVVMPDFTKQLEGEYVKPRASKEFKQKQAEFLRVNEDKEVVEQADYDALLGIVSSLAENERVQEYVRDSARELSIVWDDDRSGLRCKARLDVCQAGKRVVDLKTALDASPRGFGKSIANYDYHRQAAFYLDGAVAVGLDPQEFCFIAVEKTAPYGCIAAPLPASALLQGHDEYRDILADIAECRRTGVWPSYENPEMWPELPAWMAGRQVPLTLTLGGREVTL